MATISDRNTLPPVSVALPAPAAVLPHRPPFLFLDRVLLCEPGRIVAERTFRIEEPFFEGHFPGNPIVPGVILLEALAQTLAYGVLRQTPGQKILLTGIEHCKFRQPVLPGQQVFFEVKPERTVMNVTQATGVVSVGGAMVAQATIKGYVGK